ncbi:RTA1 like protein-domain-containing protein [Rhodofomes roseus]|uniref:RTA1 like protein-domain-containing protein n=1 Tax=Rhodofomes roseus TaxID=34475 RepID=A0ABQ8JZ28_9APHY|nr:RTA1 like protein-domain-containing protein [Rhodofomes roseus]KAH9829049.1 RTA1 like protein-domain-containing protein [Rhodofomes roseus]
MLTSLPMYLLADAPARPGTYSPAHLPTLPDDQLNLLSDIRSTRRDPPYPAIDPYPFTTSAIVTTIIAPTPLVAANFVILGELIRRLGPSYSRLSPVWYTAVFVCCDIVSLVVQAVGGGMAATAVNQYESPAMGGHIMLAGIAFQMASITVYMLLASEFALRFLYDKPVRDVVHASGRHHFNRNAKLMLLGLTFSSLCIFIRSVYRTIELAGGWDGYIISTQRYLNWLDGGMITLAMFCLNLFHPGYLLGKRDTWKASRVDSEKLTSEPATPVKTVL